MHRRRTPGATRPAWTGTRIWSGYSTRARPRAACAGRGRRRRPCRQTPGPRRHVEDARAGRADEPLDQRIGEEVRVVAGIELLDAIVAMGDHVVQEGDDARPKVRAFGRSEEHT